MARADELLEHPLLGHHGVFITTAADSYGEVLELEFTILPHRPRLPARVHLHQHERVIMLDGELRFRVGLRRRTARAGDVIGIPPRQSHAFDSLTDIPARFRVQFRPALRLEDVFAALYALPDEQGHRRLAIPTLRATAPLACDHPHEFFYLPRVAPAIQRAALAPIRGLRLARRPTATPSGGRRQASRAATNEAFQR